MLSGFPNDVPEDVTALLAALVRKGGDVESLLTQLRQALGNHGQTITILAVDDDGAQRYAILQKAGYSVLEASTGSDALLKAAHHPSVILLDP